MTNTCTAVNEQRLVLGGREELANMADEPNDRHYVVRDTVVWPCSVVELSDCD